MIITKLTKVIMLMLIMTLRLRMMFDNEVCLLTRQLQSCCEHFPFGHLLLKVINFYN